MAEDKRNYNYSVGLNLKHGASGRGPKGKPFKVFESSPSSGNPPPYSSVEVISKGAENAGQIIKKEKEKLRDGEKLEVTQQSDSGGITHFKAQRQTWDRKPLKRPRE